MAIGNGALNFPNNYATMVPLYYYHGLVRDEWGFFSCFKKFRLYLKIRDTCCNGNIETCDIFGEFSDPICSPIIIEVAYFQVITKYWQALDGTDDLDPYNLYSTCYLPNAVNATSKRAFIERVLRKRVGLPPRKVKDIAATNDTVTVKFSSTRKC